MVKQDENMLKQGEKMVKENMGKLNTSLFPL
jgi:hypothetical protein